MHLFSRRTSRDNNSLLRRTLYSSDRVSAEFLKVIIVRQYATDHCRYT